MLHLLAVRQDTRSFAAFGHLSYNQVVEKLIAYEEQSLLPYYTLVLGVCFGFTYMSCWVFVVGDVGMHRIINLKTPPKGNVVVSRVVKSFLFRCSLSGASFATSIWWEGGWGWGWRLSR